MFKRPTANQARETLPRVEEFLKAIQGKTTDKVHRRLLQASSQGDPAASLEAELNLVIEEILDEN